MRRTDPVSPVTAGPFSAVRLFSAFPRFAVFAVAVLACTTIAARQSSTQDQDVAEAARQERARKEAQHKKPKHVYTEEDLKRAQILTPEDRAELEAKKNEQPSSDADKTEEALDSLPLSPNVKASSLTPDHFPNPLPPDSPLGDVARYYRRWKVSQALRHEQQFLLALPNAPVLASPKAMQPLRAPLPLADPQPPRFDPSQPLVHPSRRARPALKPEPPQFAPFQPPVKRSPFARPKFFTADPPRVLSSRPAPPSLSTQLPAVPVAPVAPAKPSKSFALDNPSKPVPARSSKPLTRMNPPALIAPSAPTKPLASAAPSAPVAPMQPSKPFTSANPSPRVAPAKSAKPLTRANPPSLGASIAPPKALPSAGPPAPVEQVQPSKKPFVFGSPSKPFSASKAFELLAHVNPPAFVAPLAPPKPLPSAGPSAPTVPVEPSVPSPLLAPVAPATLATLTVQPGDSLWKLAALHLGAGLRWREFLSVNPNIQDANHIEAGSQIVVPAAAYPSRKLRALTVQQGDTLSGIAKAHLGRASAWHCIAGANPSILNPHLIYPGQSLLLPTSCKP